MSQELTKDIPWGKAMLSLAHNLGLLEKGVLTQADLDHFGNQPMTQRLADDERALTTAYTILSNDPGWDGTTLEEYRRIQAEPDDTEFAEEDDEETET